ncbi:dynamin family protein [Brachyspira aalborgi]
MVIGKAKSGKSTFINAYLKKEVLPMDVRQCTSSIIKIN